MENLGPSLFFFFDYLRLTLSYTHSLPGWSNTNSHNKNHQESINTKVCGDTDRCVTGNDQRGTTGGVDTGSQNGKEESIEFEIPGFQDSVEDSIDVVRTRETISKTEVNKEVNSI